MTEKILETIIVAFTKELISQTKELFSDIHDEAKAFIGSDLKKYLEKQKTKYAHIKTLLKGNTPVYLYEIYYPINLIDIDSAEILHTDKISNLFKLSNYVTILGDAGSGKSTLTKHLFLNAIQSKFAIPILVELRYLNETEGDIKKFILEKIFENKLTENANILNRLLSNGKFVFFLDGFDELNADIKLVVVKNLNSFINEYDENRFIITSRPYSNIEDLPLFYNYKIKNLENSKGEIDGFVDHQLKKEPELAEKIKKSLKENKSVYIQSFLTNPLLLTLYILTFQTNAEIPNKKYIFYRRVINALFSEHDSKTKLGYIREKKSKLSQEQFEEVLKAFCFLSYFEQRFDFDFDYINTTLKIVKQRISKFDFDNNKFIYDLTSAIALWTEDNGIYGFAHRSLQEYFAALFVKNLNPVDNERAYQKIISKFENSSRNWEYENFLSLCQEMDEINFNKFYYLPLLQEILSVLDNSSPEKLAQSLILFFTEGFTCSINSGSANERTGILIKDSVYRTIFIHLSYTRPLYDLLNRIAREKQILKHKNMVQINSENVKILKLEHDLPEDLTQCLLNDKIKLLAKEFYDFIYKEIETITKNIEQSSKSDRELLDLI